MTATERQIESGDDSDLSENPFHFYIGENLSPGTYYIVVLGYEATTGPYSLHTMTAADQGGTVDACGGPDAWAIQWMASSGLPGKRTYTR